MQEFLQTTEVRKNSYHRLKRNRFLSASFRFRVYGVDTADLCLCGNSFPPRNLQRSTRECSDNCKRPGSREKCGGFTRVRINAV